MVRFVWRVFVYGSLMNPCEVLRTLGRSCVGGLGRCRELVEECFRARVAMVRGYRRIFNKRSKRWGAALNLECSGNERDEVWGILLYLDLQDYVRVKAREVHYVEYPVCVYSFKDGREVRESALTFVSFDRVSYGKPSREYVELVLRGAKVWGILDRVLENLYLADGRPLKDDVEYAGIVYNVRKD